MRSFVWALGLTWGSDRAKQGSIDLLVLGWHLAFPFPGSFLRIFVSLPLRPCIDCGKPRLLFPFIFKSQLRQFVGFDPIPLVGI